MKLIDEKKFLKEYTDTFKNDTYGGYVIEVERILSKHLKDLPKKKDYRVFMSDTKAQARANLKARGYNRCLEDCES